MSSGDEKLNYRVETNNEAVIKQLDPSALPFAVEVIRTSFATVAEDLGLTE